VLRHAAYARRGAFCPAQPLPFKSRDPRPVQGDGTLQLRAPTTRRLAGQTSGFRCSPKHAAIALGVLQIIVEVLALFLTIIACEYLLCTHWVG